MRLSPLHLRYLACFLLGILVAGAWGWWRDRGIDRHRAHASTGALDMRMGDFGSPADGFFSRNGRWFLVFQDVEAVALSEADGACSLGETATLRVEARLRSVEGGDGDGDGGEGAATREPICHYHALLPHRGPECLVEFRGESIDGFATPGIGASLAAAYYDRRQGGMVYVKEEGASARPAGEEASAEARLFLVMDDRWCRWFGAAEGFRISG